VLLKGWLTQITNILSLAVFFSTYVGYLGSFRSLWLALASLFLDAFEHVNLGLIQYVYICIYIGMTAYVRAAFQKSSVIGAL
jgi:hypothetical protein